ncbi:MAG: helix-turn-helix transcriptional regulator [Clostridiales bacterium]|nr:helix-turn-helix transcriptional regulator [Clostridiales bacterium]
MTDRIKNLRIDSDYTQAYVARAIGISQRKYSYIETGIQQLTDDLIIKLALFYNTSADYLLGLSDDPTPRWKQR